MISRDRSIKPGFTIFVVLFVLDRFEEIAETVVVVLHQFQVEVSLSGLDKHTDASCCCSRSSWNLLGSAAC